MLLGFFAACVLYLNQGSLGVKPISAQSSCEVAGNLLIQTQAEKTLFDKINTYRAQNGISVLVWSSTLKKASAWLSNDMATKNYFSHTDSLGRNPGQRLTDCGYSWSAYGENIYPNSSDPQAVFDSWKNSSAHNEAMLSSEYSQAGIGSNGNYWTLNLGRSSGSTVEPTAPVLQNPTPTGITPTSILSLSPTRTVSPTPTPSIILNPTDTKIQVGIKLLGIGKGKNESPKNLTRLVEVSVFDLENKKILSGNNHLKYNNSDSFIGEIHLGQIPNGSYYVKVRGVNTLASLIVPEFQFLDSSKLNVLPEVILIQGDFTNDNIINIKDFNIMVSCFLKKPCPAGISIDLNDNGSNDVVDYNIFLASFKRNEGD